VVAHVRRPDVDGECASITRLYQAAVYKVLDGNEHAIALNERKALHDLVNKEEISVDVEVPPFSSELASISREFDHATFDCYFSASAIIARGDAKILPLLLKTLKYHRDYDHVAICCRIALSMRCRVQKF